ncbi:MAG: DNA gyrase subunit A [Deltaproteobacteria bacterium]|nr:DNA gyrase subunit A [Deltaproteobacteria bacterium]
MNHAAEVIPINIEDEMKGSYLDYSMSVIIGRALPDVRDGLKPVHRRILYAMFREGLLSSRRFSKCAGVVGEVLKKYHPHGDSAVYDTLVRMAQDWNMRYPLIDGQGNFGSVDGDSAAAYRYTEARLKALAEELLADIDKETVDFAPNFDGTTLEPIVLPSRVPNLIINGSDGIAVGMATKIPPHNLKEIIDGCLEIIRNPSVTPRELMKFIPGPDFPTAGFIHGREGIRSAYETGRGSLQIRARAAIEPIAKGDREAIVVTEIPYQVNKAKLVERIAELVRDGKLEGVSDLRDESDRDGMRIVVELKRGAVAGVVLNQLYAHTSMQTSFGVILLSIVNGQPKILNLRDMLGYFVDHRKEVVIRRTSYDLRKTEERAHILEGLKIAIENIDRVIELIKKSKEPAAAKVALIKTFDLSEIQAQAISEMRLQRLTGLERDKIVEEYKEVQALIKELKAILADERLVMKIISDELKEIQKKYGDDRRTQIQDKTTDLSVEDLIQEEEMVVTVSHHGYIKRNPISIYRAQRRGGKGKTGMTTREEDFVEELFVASTHSYVLIFSNIGKLYWLKVHQIPQVGRVARGQSISGLVNMSSSENIAAILPVRKFEEGKFIVMATQKGVIKKTDLMAYSNVRAGGLIACNLDDGDALIGCSLTDGSQEVFLATKEGQAIRFPEEDVRDMGRVARGVRGISLRDKDEVIGMEVLGSNATILTVTERGYGKRTGRDEYRLQSRAGSGIINLKVTDKTGNVIGVMQVTDQDDIMLVTDGGKVIRSHCSEISTIGRATQGVRLINVDQNEKVVSVAKLAEGDEDDGEE